MPGGVDEVDAGGTLSVLLASIAQFRARRREERDVGDGRTQEEVAADLVRLRRGCDELQLEFGVEAAGFAATDEYDIQGSCSPSQWIKHQCQMGGGAASDAICVGEQAAALPDSSRALEEGRIGYGHLALLARTRQAIATSATASGEFCETALLRKAQAHTVSRFRHDCEHARHAADQRAVLAEHVAAVEARSLELETCPGGMFLRGFVDAVGGATLRTALEPLAAPLGADDHRLRDRRLADALVELAAHSLDGELPGADGAMGAPGPARLIGAIGAAGAAGVGGGAAAAADVAGAARANGIRRKRPHLQVTASLETLLGIDGSPAGELDFAPPIAAATVQRLACDASVTRVLLGPDSAVVDVGRSRRVPSGATRRALVLRDKGCTWPGCERPAAWTEAHHLRHWGRGGPTELGNLVLVLPRAPLESPRGRLAAGAGEGRPAADDPAGWWRRPAALRPRAGGRCGLRRRAASVAQIAGRRERCAHRGRPERCERRGHRPA